MREDGLVAHVPGRRRYSSYEGEVTPAPDNLVNRDFTAERPNEKWLTDTTRDQGQRRKGVPFADDRLLRRHGRGAHGRDVAERGTGATRCRVRAAATLRPGERPVVHGDRGCHYRWPGWLERMGRHGLVRSMGAKGCSPDNAAAEGFFGRMKDRVRASPGIGRNARARRSSASPANTSAGTTIRGSNSRWAGKAR